MYLNNTIIINKDFIDKNLFFISFIKHNIVSEIEMKNKLIL
jgi:hypothetical protein